MNHLRRMIMFLLISAAILAALIAIFSEMFGQRNFVREGLETVSDRLNPSAAEPAAKDADRPMPEVMRDIKKNTESFQKKIDDSYERAFEVIDQTPTPGN
jgi:hypothetical protein